jgi:hypothetical protein
VTESDWATCADPQLMLEFLRDRGGADDRRLRLFACACCRSVWHLLADERGRAMVEVAERFVDGTAREDELLAAAKAANHAAYPDVRTTPRTVRDALRAAHLTGYTPGTAAAYLEPPPPHARPWYGGYAASAFSAPDYFAVMARLFAADAAVGAPYLTSAYWEALKAEMGRQAPLLRDIFGNPFKPTQFDPSWRSETAVALALQQYERRDFLLMPILGDALQDAGCEDEGILNHCRGSGPHVRGCHVVDLVLGLS